jgi:hypothetical protein
MPVSPAIRLDRREAEEAGRETRRLTDDKTPPSVVEPARPGVAPRWTVIR